MKREENWFKNGDYYRSNDKPTYINYHYSGEKYIEEWSNEKGPHRLYNPAVIRYNKNGEEIERSYYICSKFYGHEENLNYLVACGEMGE